MTLFTCSYFGKPLRWFLLIKNRNINGSENKVKNKNTWLAVALISTLAICLFGCLGVGLALRFAPNLLQYNLRNSSLKVGEAAPDFELTSLDGGTVSLSQFKGTPVLLSFGATWCPDCRIEAPLLEEVHRSHPELVVLLVDVNEGPDVVRQYMSELGITHPILLDSDGAVMAQYRSMFPAYCL
jgi:thiol-disulfide isomerase/thioredoxin